MSSDTNRERFVIAPVELYNNEYLKIVILTDYNFWTEHTDELTDWCENNGAKFRGMTVTFPTEQILAAFILRWE